MIIPSQLDEDLRRDITKAIRKEHEIESAKHEPSGRLSASQLGKPLLEQVLKIIGVPPKPVEDYSLGVFSRGNDVEKRYLHYLAPDEQQVEVLYRGVIGYVDAVKAVRVYEIKSIKNSAVPYIDPDNDKKRWDMVDGKKQLVRVYTGPKYAHVLQGGLYALGKNQDTFTIVYIAADDFRTYPHVLSTDYVKTEIDRIIDEVAATLKGGVLPEWTEREEWQRKYPKYSNYPDWMYLDQETMMAKLQKQYPDAYKRLKSYAKKKVAA